MLKAGERESQNYLIKTLGYCLVEAKRSFDALVKDHISRMDGYRLRSNKKYGILPFVIEMEQFCEMSEEIWAGADDVRRTELDRAYANLTRCVFETINRTARTSERTPEHVICFQNYHHMFALFSRLKVQSLQNSRKAAKERYQNHMDDYILQFMGRPLEKLSLFFEGVENLIQGGIAEEDVKFQIEYSNQELRKILKAYSAKDVRKGLLALYLKTEKHTEQDQHRLLQVVWLKMQDEFLRQFANFQDLITRCYGSNASRLEFQEEDILKTFEDIAQQH